MPSCPRERIRRVDARFSARRSIVEMSRMVGNAENSSGAWMNSAVIRISTDRMMETAREKSSSIAGSGRIRTMRMVSTPIASARSPRLARSAKRKPGNENPPDCPAVTSVSGTWRPSTDCMSSSLAMTTSTYFMSGRMTSCAFASDQSFLRKLRSTDTRAPAFFAASTARLTSSSFEAGKRPTTSDVSAGLTLSNHSPDEDLTHSPPM